MPKPTRETFDRSGRGDAEVAYRNELHEEYERMAQAHPSQAVVNGHLDHGKLGWREGQRMALAFSDYLPFGLKAIYGRYSLDHPEREWLGPRRERTPYGNPLSNLPDVHRQLVPHGVGRQTPGPASPPSLRAAKGDLLDRWDMRMSAKAVATELKAMGQENRDNFRCVEMVAASEELAKQGFWDANTDRFHGYMVPTPEGPVVLYTRPPGKFGAGHNQAEFIDMVLSHHALMQHAVLTKPGSTAEERHAEARGIARRGIVQSRITNTHDKGGIMAIAAVPETTSHGLVEGILTDNGSRSHVFPVGVTGNTKSKISEGILVSMDAPAAFVIEPKAEDGPAIANRLQKGGHRVRLLDLRPVREQEHTFTPIEPPRNIHDYLYDGPVRYAGLDPVEDIDRLIGPGGYARAHQLGGEIFDSLLSTIETGSQDGEMKKHAGTMKGDVSDAIACCLQRAALKVKESQLAGEQTSFWAAFDDGWSTLTGQTPNPDAMSQIQALHDNGTLGAPSKRGFVNGRYRGAAFAAVMDEEAREHAETPGVDGDTLAEMRSRSAAVATQVGEAEQGRGLDVYTWMFSNGGRLLKSTYGCLAEPGTGLTVDRMHAANVIACVQIGGEHDGRVGLPYQLFSRAVDRQLADLKNREVACASALRAELERTGEKPTAKMVLDHYAPVGGIPSEVTRFPLPPDQAKLNKDAGLGGLPRPLLVEWHNEVGSLARNEDKDRIRARLAMGAESRTGIYCLQATSDITDMGLPLSYLAGHIVIGMGDIQQDTGLAGILGNAGQTEIEYRPPDRKGVGRRAIIGPPNSGHAAQRQMRETTIGREARWWDPEGFRDVKDATYVAVSIPSKASGREQYLLERYPTFHGQRSGGLFIARALTAPATTEHAELKTPYSADTVLSRIKVREDGTLEFPLPERDIEASSKLELVKYRLDERTLKRAANRPLRPPLEEDIEVSKAVGGALKSQAEMHAQLRQVRLARVAGDVGGSPTSETAGAPAATAEVRQPADVRQAAEVSRPTAVRGAAEVRRPTDARPAADVRQPTDVPAAPEVKPAAEVAQAAHAPKTTPASGASDAPRTVKGPGESGSVETANVDPPFDMPAVKIDKPEPPTQAPARPAQVKVDKPEPPTQAPAAPAQVNVAEPEAPAKPVAENVAKPTSPYDEVTGIDDDDFTIGGR